MNCLCFYRFLLLSVAVVYVLTADVDESQTVEDRNDPCARLGCLNGGSCRQGDSGGFNCHCPNGWTGSRCQERYDSCASSPCQNGGSCIPNRYSEGFYCQCPNEWMRSRCQETNPCVSNPCNNGGSCNPTSETTFTCSCTNKWTGAFCQNAKEDPCLNLENGGRLNDCENDARCITYADGSRRCRCYRGTSGDRCQNNDGGDDPCARKDCQNGGECVRMGWWETKCLCQLGYKGSKCQTAGDSEGIPPMIYDDEQKFISAPYLWSILLQCGDFPSGNPEPRIEWRKNGRPLTMGGQYTVDVFSSLYLQQLRPEDEGEYQCFAINQFGTAVSHKKYVNHLYESKPRLEAYKETNVVAVVGSTRFLRCYAPYSSEPRSVRWEKYVIGVGINEVQTGRRIYNNSEGLFITDVVESDRGCYVARFYDQMTNREETGCTLCLQVLSPPSGMPQSLSRPVTLLWSNASHILTIAGTPLYLHCLFAGRPTPTVLWKYQDRDTSDWRSVTDAEGTVEVSEFGRTLVIKNVTLKTPVMWACEGRNNISMPMSQSFSLNIKATPTWKVKPVSMNVTEGESVTMICDAYAAPAPAIRWSINGIPIQDLPVQPNRVIGANGRQLSFQPVRLDDTSVIQCNATNSYGYVFTNAYIRVMPSP